MCRNTCHKGKMKKGVSEMTSGVNGIGGNPYSYGNYGYTNGQAQSSQEEEQQEVQVQSPEYKPVSDEAVMQFLEANNLRVVPAVPQVELTPEDEERIASYMARFEELMGLVEQEFGLEMAPVVMNLVMDKLIGMA